MSVLNDAIQTANRPVKWCSVPCAVRELQIETMSEIPTTQPPPTGRNTTQDTRRWGGRGAATGTLARGWCRCKMVQPLRKARLQFLTNTKHILPHAPTITCLSSSKLSWKLCPPKNLHKNICGSFIHNWQNLEPTTISFNGWMEG